MRSTVAGTKRKKPPTSFATFLGCTVAMLALYGQAGCAADLDASDERRDCVRSGRGPKSGSLPPHCTETDSGTLDGADDGGTVDGGEEEYDGGTPSDGGEEYDGGTTYDGGTSFSSGDFRAAILTPLAWGGCGIGENALSTAPLTLDNFGTNGAVIFELDTASTEIAHQVSPATSTIHGQAGWTCKIRQGVDRLDVECTSPTAAVCTETLLLQ